MPVWQGVLEHYRALLSIPEGTPAVTLLEGNTPLLPVPRLAREWGAAAAYIKYEGLNPTGSFKDRGMAVAVSVAAARGTRRLICASTGNTAASAAAYAARAGLGCIVLIPQGQVAAGKLAGARAYGATVVQVEGSFDAALELVQELAPRLAAALVNSLNPDRLEGQKTGAFEICDTLGRAPDWLALPVGNAGNITSLWMGFRQYAEARGLSTPGLLGGQAAGAAPLVVGHPVEDPRTVASAIRIGRPARGEQALAAAKESGGRIRAVSDEAILRAQADLAGEGIWVEPAAAAGVAAVRAEVEAGQMHLRGKTIVCVCTGHGLKDPAVFPGADAATLRAPARADALLAVLLK
ncbi:MAG: threonine synthase [Anaerolineales bacterium]